MYTIFRGVTAFLIIFLLYLPLSAQSVPGGQEPLLGQGFDIRNLDPKYWLSPTLTIDKPRRVINVTKTAKERYSNATVTKIKPVASSKIFFVETAYDYEKKVLESDNINQLYLSGNSRAFQNRVLEDASKPILVYFSFEQPHYSVKLNKISLDSLFIDRVSRLGQDITAAGFVHQFGTHYAKEVTYGGTFISRHTIVRDEYIYSPYFKDEFQEKVKEFLSHDNKGFLFEDNFLNVRNSHYYSVGGDESVRPFSKWETSIKQAPAPIKVELERITSLLTSSNFMDIEDIAEKRQLLEKFIEEAEKEVKSRMKPEANGDYFKKFSIPFRQRVITVEKIESGKESDRVSEFTGDLFFGGYAEDQTLIKLAPVIDYGGVRLETLITDEKIEVNKFLDMIVPPEYFKGGYVNVWDESGKMIKGLGRTDLVVTGKPENRTYFKEALRKKVMKKIELRSIDNDLYQITYSLEHVRVENNIFKPNTGYDYVMDSEIIAAASTGNVDLIRELFRKGANKQAQGIIKAAIISTQRPEVFNVILDHKVIPSTSDLDLAFEVDYFNPEVALILLERGAKPKNNMIFKAVAYREPNVIRALIREDAVPMNNDLDFALKLRDEEVISALTGRRVKSIINGDVVFEEEARKDGEESLVLYEVKSGDFLIKIAKKFDVEVNDIKTWNNIKTATIFVNQKLKIFTKKDSFALKEIENAEETSRPVSLSEITEGNEDIVVYTVKPGDYLIKIAEENHVTVAEMKQWNELNTDNIKPGQKLYIRVEKEEKSQQSPNKIIPKDALSVTNEVLANSEKESISAVPKKQNETKKPMREADLSNKDIAVAIENEKEEEVLKRIEKAETVNDQLISKAAREGQAEVVKTLLKKGVSPDLALDNAIYYRELPILEILLNNGAKLTQKHFNLIIKTNFLKAFKLYIEKGISPSMLYTGETSIHQIVQVYTPERVEMLRFLIEKGYHVDIKNQKGETPLHRAVRVGEQNLPVVRLLLENKADPSSQNKAGEKVYEATNNTEILELLKKYAKKAAGNSR